MSENSKVLITDGRWRKTLATVRALGKKGINVTCSDSTGLACALFSRYCKKKLIYPSIKKKPHEFIDFIIREIKREKYRVLFPLEEETIKLIVNNRNAFPSNISIPLADKEKIYMAMNKKEVLKFAIKEGIPCPKTYFIKSLDEIERIKNKITFPAVIKPQVGSGAKGLKYIEYQKDLEEEYRKVHNIFSYPLIQERIPAGGAAIGVSALFDENSRPVASFTHRRIREYPVKGGASTLCESCFEPDITELGLELLKKLNWYGLAMVEFKVDPRDNSPKLMEINARPWGSIQLAIYGGVNFPYLLYKIALGKKINKTYTYKAGLKFRWLIPGDILHFISNPKRMNLKPGFFDFFASDTTYAVISRDDPLPVLGKILTGLTFIYDEDMRKNLFLKLGL